MTRRTFLSNLALGVAAFSILPSAATYKRRWVKRQQLYRPNPDYVAAPYEMWIVTSDPLYSVDVLRPINYAPARGGGLVKWTKRTDQFGAPLRFGWDGSDFSLVPPVLPA